MSDLADALRPREFALLLLAGGDVAPRRRARDQQSDRAGLALKRRILEELVARDPEPNRLEEALLEISREVDGPIGPARSLARMLMQEWQTARTAPEWISQLLDSAVERTQTEAPRSGRELPG